jgi:hypothetical protein
MQGALGEAIGANRPQNFGAEPGEPVEQAVDFVLEAEPIGNVIDELE